MALKKHFWKKNLMERKTPPLSWKIALKFPFYSSRNSRDQILIKIPFLILYDARKLSSLISSWRKRLTRCRVVGIKIALSYFSNRLLGKLNLQLRTMLILFSIFIDFICISTYVTWCTVCSIQYSKSTHLI